VNDELVNLPITLDEGKVSVYKSGWYAVVTTDFGLKVFFNWQSAVFVTLPSNYMGAVCGLCGNYNGKPHDDLIPKNGRKPIKPAEFATSWRVSKIPGCVEGCTGVCPNCDITQKLQYEKGNYCGMIRDPKGPFHRCHAKVDPAGYFEDCVYDVCLYKGRKDVLCQAITSYMSACQAMGVKVESWRTKQFCCENMFNLKTEFLLKHYLLSFKRRIFTVDMYFECFFCFMVTVVCPLCSSEMPPT